MSLKNDTPTRKKLEQADNIYAEVCKIMTTARSLAMECDNKVLHSQAITHVINGTEPAHQFVHDFRDEYEAYQIRDLFCSIDDEEICNAVYDSFYASKKNKNLIFIYNDITDEPTKSRVRVLTRMLWYKLIKF